MSQLAHKKPSLRARNWMGISARAAVKVLVYPLVLGLVSLIVAPLLMTEQAFLRIPLNLIVLGVFALLLYSDGLNRGERDTHSAAILEKRMATGYNPTDNELSGCYHPLKGLTAALLGALPFFLLAVALSLLAQPYTYQLQGLPSYLTPYLRRTDVGAPLAFYQEQVSPAVVDYIRVVVRLVIMSAAHMVSGMGDAASLLIDRLSPLLVLILPTAYAIGYLQGPDAYIKNLARNEEAKKAHMKKIKRKQKRAKAARDKKGPEQLV